MDVTRRSVLYGSGVLAVSVTGCLTSDATTTPARSPTDAPTEALEFTAEVRQQSSTESPARIVARLRNAGDDPVDVGFGPTLLFTDDGDLEWASDLVLGPGVHGVRMSDPEHVDGCWRFPEDGTVAPQSSLDFRSMAPGESIRETYDVYTRGGRPCLPAGSYRFQDEMYVESESRPVVATLDVQVSEQRHLGVEATVDAGG